MGRHSPLGVYKRDPEYMHLFNLEGKMVNYLERCRKALLQASQQNKERQLSSEQLAQLRETMNSILLQAIVYAKTQQQQNGGYHDTNAA